MWQAARITCEEFYREELDDLTIRVDCPFPPALFVAQDGKTYVVGGGPWIEVPTGTLLEDIEWTGYPERIEPVNDDQLWTVSGSKGKTYTVRVTNGHWSCTCPGHQFRRKCRHVAAQKVAA